MYYPAMKIRMNELLDSLVRTVTEDAEVREIRASDHLTAVRSRRWGLASRLGRAGADPRAVDQELLDGLLPMTALELASLARDRSPERASIGVAALNSVLPLLPAKQRKLDEPGDWIPGTWHVECPDPAGQVIMEIIPIENTYTK